MNRVLDPWSGILYCDLMSEIKPIKRRRMFAHMDGWDHEWNDGAEEKAIVADQGNGRVLAVGWFGTIKLDMTNEADVRACLEATRAFADELEAYHKTTQKPTLRVV